MKTYTIIFKILAFTTALFVIVPASAFGDNQPESICYGTAAKGRLDHGVKLPVKGNNFATYSRVLSGVGRTYVHSKVHEVIVNAYKSLEATHPDKHFVYGETGWKTGGRFKPHKTHQNGLSVDFMVPVIDAKGLSIPLPTSPFNKYGYNIEFDPNGRSDNYAIDFESMAAHIKTLHIEAQKAGITIWRVIFDPDLQPLLYRTKEGKYLRENIQIPKKKSWVRHDDHYHVDFEVNCKPL